MLQFRILAWTLNDSFFSVFPHKGGGGFIGTLGTPPVMSVSKRESITFDAAHTTQPGLVHS